jgi:hypothetical protein
MSSWSRMVNSGIWHLKVDVRARARCMREGDLLRYYSSRALSPSVKIGAIKDLPLIDDAPPPMHITSAPARLPFGLRGVIITTTERGLLINEGSRDILRVDGHERRLERCQHGVR